MKQPLTAEPPEGIPQDDERLVAQACTDPTAFTGLYERYRPEIHAFVLRRVGDPHKAEDITSQVFLRALRGLPTYRSGSFRGWLFQIARNTIIDFYRRDRPMSREDAIADRPDPRPGPPELAEVKEARDQMRDLLRHLSDSQRNVIQLRLHGYTGHEIAEALGMSLGAVKSAQFRAFSRIRSLMQEASPEPPDADHTRFQRRHG